MIKKTIPKILKKVCLVLRKKNKKGNMKSKKRMNNLKKMKLKMINPLNSKVTQE